MDAASNNGVGVDDIRDLRVTRSPICRQSANTRYISSTRFMLSTQAFNALLKRWRNRRSTSSSSSPPPLRYRRLPRHDPEPLPAVRFHPHHGGRRYCQAAAVCGQAEEKIELDSAAQLISRLADGAMRDALSILTPAPVSTTRSTRALVHSRMAGVTDRGYLILKSATPSRRGFHPALQNR